MQSLQGHFANFWKYRYLLQNLITRDFKLKYRRSVLGVAWSVLNPLLTCLVMFLVFDSIMKGLRGEGIPNFAGFLIIGQLLFNFFREATSMAMESVLKNAPLLRKVYIPKYIFPMEKCCFALVNCAFSFIALVVVFVITWTPVTCSFIALVVVFVITWTPVTWATAWMAVYPLLMLFFFSLGIGLLLSALYVFVRDIMHIWEVFCTLLVYASAIFYDPETLSGIMQRLIHIKSCSGSSTSTRCTGTSRRSAAACCGAKGWTQRCLRSASSALWSAWRWAFSCSRKTRTSLSCTCKGRARIWRHNSPSSRSSMSRCASTLPRKSTRA